MDREDLVFEADIFIEMPLTRLLGYLKRLEKFQRELDAIGNKSNPHFNARASLTSILIELQEDKRKAFRFLNRMKEGRNVDVDGVFIKRT